jgi:hypothetical protein
MVLKGTVDNNIFQIAQRKLRLDKEVLEVSERDQEGERKSRDGGSSRQGGVGCCALGTHAHLGSAPVGVWLGGAFERHRE